MSRLRTPAHPAYLRLVRASAWYDLVVTAGFATPWTYALVHDALSSSGSALGLGGLPELDPWQTLFANLMGSVVVVWAALRIVRPLPEYGAFDGIARVLFATWQAYALVHGVSRLLWLFLAVELTFGVLQLAPWVRGRGVGPGDGRRVGAAST
ncbi:hypothetical protein [Streptomyces pseudovenezuelae]|uniref:DUF4345 domain-containing protein n=1 Tax=Streptomyces pseudovenezuelae TaxID=67350 RepID=A0ABT6LLU1_9ACTN|nr:hypothetical protein [Streptomyces pseudovenezuelae]MDH6217280.1 hypothetical protein [Streptomyces pseudovenezuelae]